MAGMALRILRCRLFFLISSPSFRHGFFVRDVLEPYRSHLSLHWPVEKINLVEAEHRDLIKLCKDDPVLRATIDKHDHKMMFDDV
jgi:hypothetical protein